MDQDYRFRGFCRAAIAARFSAALCRVNVASTISCQADARVFVSVMVEEPDRYCLNIVKFVFFD